MSEELKLAQAKAVYATLCSALDQRNWRYDGQEEKLQVFFGVRGDDIPMDFLIRVDAERQLIRLHSLMPYKMPEGKRIDGAIATSIINYRLADGSFQIDLSDGSIVFKMVAIYRDCKITEELFHYLIGCSCAMVDEFNDALQGVSDGSLSMEDFIRKYS